MTCPRRWGKLGWGAGTANPRIIFEILEVDKMPSFWEKLQVDGQEMDVYASVPSGSGPFPAIAWGAELPGWPQPPILTSRQQCRTTVAISLLNGGTQKKLHLS